MLDDGEEFLEIPYAGKSGSPWNILGTFFGKTAGAFSVLNILVNLFRCTSSVVL